jgi:hypothetical protein
MGHNKTSLVKSLSRNSLLVRTTLARSLMHDLKRRNLHHPLYHRLRNPCTTPVQHHPPYTPRGRCTASALMAGLSNRPKRSTGYRPANLKPSKQPARAGRSRCEPERGNEREKPVIPASVPSEEGPDNCTDNGAYSKETNQSHKRS